MSEATREVVGKAADFELVATQDANGKAFFELITPAGISAVLVERSVAEHLFKQFVQLTEENERLREAAADAHLGERERAHEQYVAWLKDQGDKLHALMREKKARRQPLTG